MIDEQGQQLLMAKATRHFKLDEKCRNRNTTIIESSEKLPGWKSRFGTRQTSTRRLFGRVLQSLTGWGRMTEGGNVSAAQALLDLGSAAGSHAP